MGFEGNFKSTCYNLDQGVGLTDRQPTLSCVEPKNVATTVHNKYCMTGALSLQCYSMHSTSLHFIAVRANQRKSLSAKVMIHS